MGAKGIAIRLLQVLKLTKGKASRRMLLLALVMLGTQAGAMAQPKKYGFRVYLADKGPINSSDTSYEGAKSYLSEASVARREKMGLRMQYSDLPVYQPYLSEIRTLGVEVVLHSKWLNMVTVTDISFDKIAPLEALPFVDSVRFVGSPAFLDTLSVESSSVSATWDERGAGDYGNSAVGFELHEAMWLHQSGYKGAGVTIALMDAGYRNVDSLKGFEALRNANGILGTRDVWSRGVEDVYDMHRHGTQVLSTMAARVEGQLIGSAPLSQYYLIRTEVSDDETGMEEDAWVSGLEWADSVGVDMVNSSLGYHKFRDSVDNLGLGELDGRTSIISIAASMAASKGLLVVTSAGNQGNDPWKKITAPADARDVLTVGACDRDGVMANFSSYGPTADGRIKPDVVSFGRGIYVLHELEDRVLESNGTSFSSPFVAGLVACWMQKWNKNIPLPELIQTLRESGHRYSNPGEQEGYGIPNFRLADWILRERREPERTKAEILNLYPNPATDKIWLEYTVKPGSHTVGILVLDMQGRVLINSQEMVNAGTQSAQRRGLDLSGLSSGMYIVALQVDGTRQTASKFFKQ